MRSNLTVFFVLMMCGIAESLPARGQSLPNLFPFPNATGVLETYNSGGRPIDLSAPFFQSLGTNGRTCGTCHRPGQGWTLSAAEVKARFLATAGLDPLFRTNDGSNCDHGIDTSTVQARLQAYSLLISKALIRVARPVPANAEFEVVSVSNPYGCNETATLSVYRRPLPATNLRLLSAVMWDGRESSPETGTQSISRATNPADLIADLAHQAMDATHDHAQATQLPSSEQLQAIVNLEIALSTAQRYDYLAGALDAGGATGGPVALATVTQQAFFIGINDPLGGGSFTPVIFNLFDAWTDPAASRRAAIARGQSLFNSKPINITGVAGLNDELQASSIPGTCGTCHNSPNAGNHSTALAVDVGVSDPEGSLDLGYLPVITLRNKATGEMKTTADPGRALITGRWKDIGQFKGPVLRGLASRPPYFHNGAAASLGEVVDFYNRRFQIGFTAQERADLIAFLNSL